MSQQVHVSCPSCKNQLKVLELTPRPQVRTCQECHATWVCALEPDPPRLTKVRLALAGAGPQSLVTVELHQPCAVPSCAAAVCEGLLAVGDHHSHKQNQKQDQKPQPRPVCLRCWFSYRHDVAKLVRRIETGRTIYQGRIARGKQQAAAHGTALRLAGDTNKALRAVGALS